MGMSVLIFYLLFVGVALPSIFTCAASLSISVGTYQDHLLHLQHGLSTRNRRLLQTQQDCPLNFENMNYTIIISRCKGPNYPSKVCCAAFKDFACPYAAQLNDEHNKCATTMFSYINLYGQYPPGLFANECRESKRGLECSDSQSGAASSAASTLSHLHPQLSASAAAFLPILGLLLLPPLH